MEGARHLPSFLLTASADPGFPLLDCDACRENRDREERQEMGCGYEERLEPEQQVALWVHPSFPVRALGKPTTCAGYTTKLPAVLRISNLGIHWERGTLRARCGGDPPAIVLDVLEQVESQRDAVRAWQENEAAERIRARGR